MIYIVVVVTAADGGVVFTVAGHSSDRWKAQALADHQKKFLAPTQSVDIFESEEIQ